MKAIILTSEARHGERLAVALRRAGFSACTVTSRVEQAEQAQRQQDACCIVFDRGFAPFGYSVFYEKFSNPAVWFIPVAPAPDLADVMRAARQRRTAYWLSRQAIWPDIRELTDCLIGKLMARVDQIPDNWLPSARVLNQYGYRRTTSR